MRDPREDQDLKELFQELKAGDRRSVPEFGPMMARAKAEAGRQGEDSGVHIYSVPTAGPQTGIQGVREAVLAWVRARNRWALTGGGVLAAAVVAAVFLIQQPETTDADFERAVHSFASNPALGAWKSPTADLLNVPGIELLKTVPKIGNPRLPGSSRGLPIMNRL